MNEYKLSYIISTKNKLPFLKEVIKRLLENRENDEEVIVIDGASTDGTGEYLEEMFLKGEINQFVSEPDFGEAHGYNKGILLAKGELIKLITDDDAYSFRHINNCKKYLLDNSEIDLLYTSGANSHWLCNRASSDKEVVICDNSVSVDLNNYTKRLMTVEPEGYFFTGCGIMFRTSSLSVLGFFNTDFVAVDGEYSIRVSSSKKIEIALCPNIVYVNVSNGCSNSITKNRLIKRDAWKLMGYYSGLKSLKVVIKYFKTSVKDWLKNKMAHILGEKKIELFKKIYHKIFIPVYYSSSSDFPSWLEAYNHAVNWLDDNYREDCVKKIIYHSKNKKL